MKTKICNGKLCKGKEKPLSEFSKNSGHIDGLQSQCKECKSIVDKKYQDKNKIKIAKQKKQYYIENKKVLKQKSKEYRESNLEYYKDYNKEYGQKPENKKRRNKLQKIRYHTDINFKITITLRNRIWDVLNRKPKNKRTLELLGCTVEELKIHLQSQFTSGMTWDNHGKGYGKWNIDHIKPCNSFDFSDFKQQELCFNYTNLQPLWSLDNIRKSDKLLN